jgi:hypothetical protein
MLSWTPDQTLVNFRSIGRIFTTTRTIRHAGIRYFVLHQYRPPDLLNWRYFSLADHAHLCKSALQKHASVLHVENLSSDGKA